MIVICAGGGGWDTVFVCIKCNKRKKMEEEGEEGGGQLLMQLQQQHHNELCKLIKKEASSIRTAVNTLGDLLRTGNQLMDIKIELQRFEQRIEQKIQDVLPKRVKRQRSGDGLCGSGLAENDTAIFHQLTGVGVGVGTQKDIRSSIVYRENNQPYQFDAGGGEGGEGDGREEDYHKRKKMLVRKGSVTQQRLQEVNEIAHDATKCNYRFHTWLIDYHKKYARTWAVSDVVIKIALEEYFCGGGGGGSSYANIIA